jgi:hypothetical protein
VTISGSIHGGKWFGPSQQKSARTVGDQAELWGPPSFAFSCRHRGKHGRKGNMSAWVSDLKGDCPRRDAAGSASPASIGIPEASFSDIGFTLCHGPPRRAIVLPSCSLTLAGLYHAVGPPKDDGAGKQFDSCRRWVPIAERPSIPREIRRKLYWSF